MRRAFLLLWAVCALYIGTAGWARAELEEEISLRSADEGDGNAVTCDGVSFASLRDCLAFQRDRQTNMLFPWVFSIPSFFGLLLLSFGFGSVGGFIRLLRLAALGQTISTPAALNIPLFGGLIGIVVLGIAYILPETLTANDAVLRPTSILFFTLFGGIFAEHVYTWLEGQITRLFPLESTK